jgi:hypothetical protein
MMMARKRDLSYLSLSPLEKIKGKVRKMEQYICRPEQIQGNTNNTISGFTTALSSKPTAIPAFINKDSLRLTWAFTPVWANR